MLGPGEGVLLCAAPAAGSPTVPLMHLSCTPTLVDTGSTAGATDGLLEAAEAAAAVAAAVAAAAAIAPSLAEKELVVGAFPAAADAWLLALALALASEDPSRARPEAKSDTDCVAEDGDEVVAPAAVPAADCAVLASVLLPAAVVTEAARAARMLLSMLAATEAISTAAVVAVFMSTPAARDLILL